MHVALECHFQSPATDVAYWLLFKSPIHWTEPFLADRFQFVRIVHSSYIGFSSAPFTRNVTNSIGSCLTPRGRVLSGVLKGNVLFILFVDDISECMAENVSVELFADDAKI
jgi:hypothetical protein